MLRGSGRRREYECKFRRPNVCRFDLRKRFLLNVKKRLTVLGVVFALFCCGLTFMYSHFDRELALCVSLANAEVNAESAAAVIDAFKIIPEFEKTDLDGKVFSEKMFSAFQTVSYVSDEGITDILNSFIYPDEAEKSVIAAFGYMSLFPRFKEIYSEESKYGGLIDVIKEKESEKLTEEKILPSVEQLSRIIRNIVGKGEEEFENACLILYGIVHAKNISEEISYKDIYTLCRYILDITGETDFRELSALDLFFGENFSEKNGEAINGVLRILREDSFEEFVSAVGYLPDYVAFSVNLAHKFFENNVISIESFTAAFTDIAYAINGENLKVDKKTVYDKVYSAIKELRMFDADNLSAEERETAEKNIGYITGIIGSFGQ